MADGKADSGLYAISQGSGLCGVSIREFWHLACGAGIAKVTVTCKQVTVTSGPLKTGSAVVVIDHRPRLRQGSPSRSRRFQWREAGQGDGQGGDRAEVEGAGAGVSAGGGMEWGEGV